MFALQTQIGHKYDLFETLELPTGKDNKSKVNSIASDAICAT